MAFLTLLLGMPIFFIVGTVLEDKLFTADAFCYNYALLPRWQKPTSFCVPNYSLLTVKQTLTKNSGSWFPRPVADDDGYDDDDDDDRDVILMNKNDWHYARLEKNSIILMARLIKQRLSAIQNGKNMKEKSREAMENNKAYLVVKGRFMDLTCTVEGERILEGLFDDDEVDNEEDDVIKGASIALQSLIMVGCQVGVKGSPEQLESRVSHLKSDDSDNLRDLTLWDDESVKRLKYNIDQTAGVQLLAELKWKRSAQGAFDLLVAMGAWTVHEDLALLRSGFPLRFTVDEEEVAKEAVMNPHDPDELLGLRKNLRHEKVYTIDSESTSEIDDALSVEVIQNDDGSEKQRFWIHIADVDRFAPRGSRIYQVAKKRAISLYLPQGSISMFPSRLSSGVMSLKGDNDLYALSLGVELMPDGSVDESSIIVVPSRIRISYRLSYDEVDEMLAEGVGYREEWQLGVLLAAAKKRRRYRIQNGSSESFVPTPIPQATVTVLPNQSALDGIGISVQVQVSHNSGKNETTAVGDGSPLDAASAVGSSSADPVSSSFLLVTEMMILAGEALGRFKLRCDREQIGSFEWTSWNKLELAFRAQNKPDYNSRSREKHVMMHLMEDNVGGGYCHAWYARRFLQPIKISETPLPHSGLGLACYVQWTSPIRRFGDLQVHCAVKRFLRRKLIQELIMQGKSLPSQLRQEDVGCTIPFSDGNSSSMATLEEAHSDGNINGIPLRDGYDGQDKIDFNERQGIVGVCRMLQRSSQQYWLFEYVRRLKQQDPDVAFDALILGCTDPERQQYAIYVYDLGLEHRYVSQKSNIKIGNRLRLKVASVSPQAGLLTFSLAKLL